MVFNQAISHELQSIKDRTGLSCSDNTLALITTIRELFVLCKMGKLLCECNDAYQFLYTEKIVC